MGFFEMLGAFILSTIFYVFTTVIFGRIVAKNTSDPGDREDVFILATYFFGALLFVAVFIFWSEGVPCPFTSQ